MEFETKNWYKGCKPLDIIMYQLERNLEDISCLLNEKLRILALMQYVQAEQYHSCD